MAEFVGVKAVKSLINDCIMLSVIASNNSMLSVLYSAAIILKSITFFIITDHQVQQESNLKLVFFLHCVMLSTSDHHIQIPTGSTKSGCLDFYSESRQYLNSLVVN